MPFRDFGNEGKSEPESVRARGGGPAHEAREDFLALRFADAGAAIFHFQHCVIAAADDAHGDGAGRVLERVADQIVDDAFEQSGVGADEDVAIGGDEDRAVGAGAQEIDACGGEVAEVDDA